MVKMLFNVPIKYNGVNYASNTLVEIDKKDLGVMKGAGGWIVEDTKPKKPEVKPVVKADKEQTADKPKAEKPAAKTTTKSKGGQTKGGQAKK